MRNLRYFTFERNRYFYGKLLSVDDFECEQRYMNDKRRLINRFVLGTGVVCGMNVVPVDDTAISVEMGMALDFAGREIMISQPVIRKLSMIDGFSDYTEEDEENSCLYLCVEYDESEKEPVHSVAGVREQGGQNMEYNKYAEGYHLFLTSQEPENEELSARAFYEETRTVYWGNGIRVKQTVPRYVRSGQEFELKITVENMGQQKPVSFSYDLNLTCIQGQDNLTISFREADYAKAKSYTLTRKLKAGAVNDIAARLTVAQNSFQMEIDGMPMKGEAGGTSAVQIISGNVKEEIISRYYQSAMEEIVKDTYQQSIYLAKISVIRTGSTYMIDAVESMPFHQYLYNNSLADAMNRMALEEEETREKSVPAESRGRASGGAQTPEQGGLKIAAGTVVIDMGIGGTPGQKFFSEEIPHGLGLGAVNIILGEVTGDGIRDSGSLLFGTAGIFDPEPGEVRVELAAKVNMEKGTFMIGVKCLEMTSQSRLRVNWIAVRDGQELVQEREQAVMQIRPDMLELAIRDVYYFEALIGGAVESRVRWSVREPDGGTIDENGMYTAPNKAGVYEILCESMDQPGFRASTFVVVRDV